MLRLLSLILLIVPATFAASLTGLSFHGTTAAGVNVPAAGRWNTLGGGTPIPNLYVYDGSGNPLNSGDGAAARINYPLGPGSYNFSYCFQPFAVGLSSFFGVDLYFDGNDAQPAISATVQELLPFSVTPNPNSVFALNGTTVAPGANTTVVVLGNLRIQLVFAYVNNQFGSMDEVSLYNNVPDGVRDCDVPGLGLRITVEEIPEPATGLLSLPLAALLLFRRRS